VALEATEPVRDVELRGAIQRIAFAARPTAARASWRSEAARLEINHKRVGRILRADNLLCLRKRKFVVTTDSEQTSASAPT